MYQQDTVRDAAVRARLAQALADYYYRRTLGVVCGDPRQPSVRAEYDEVYRRKLVLARHTLNKLLAAREFSPAELGEEHGAEPRALERERPVAARPARILPWHRRAASSYSSMAPRTGRSRPSGAAQTLASSISSIATGLPL
jgi:hypothetical protein